MNQKLKLLHVKKILEELTDEEHPITVKDIIQKLELLGYKAERKSVYQYIDDLIDFGLDIYCIKGVRNKYFLASREFETAEVRMLVDAVASSKSITNKKSLELIKKLGGLTSVYEKKKITSKSNVLQRIKTENEQMLIAIDSINKAILSKKKIKFKYYRYNVNKERVYGLEGNCYTGNPYGLIWDNDSYYCILSHDNQIELRNFRVDRMTDIEVMTDDVYMSPLSEELNIADYYKSTFKMFSGKKKRVCIRFDNSLVTTVIDRFGRDIILFDQFDGSFHVYLDIVTSPAFFSWIFMFLGRAEIISPENTVEEMKDYLKEVNEIYT